VRGCLYSLYHWIANFVGRASEAPPALPFLESASQSLKQPYIRYRSLILAKVKINSVLIITDAVRTDNMNKSFHACSVINPNRSLKRLNKYNSGKNR
jgi:hypothetical protein